MYVANYQSITSKVSSLDASAILLVPFYVDRSSKLYRMRFALWMCVSIKDYHFMGRSYQTVCPG